jgi:hypothetical protein
MTTNDPPRLPALEVRVDPHAEPGNLLPSLARLLRRLRDRQKQPGQKAPGPRPQAPA